MSVSIFQNAKWLLWWLFELLHLQSPQADMKAAANDYYPDLSAELFSHLIYKMSDNCPSEFPRAQLMPSNVFFCLMKSPKPKDIGEQRNKRLHLK